MLQRTPRGRVASLALLSISLGFECCSTPILSLKLSGCCRMLALLTSCSVQELLDQNLKLNYPQDWLEQPA